MSSTKILIKETVETKDQAKFPAYAQCGTTYYKILNNHDCIRVVSHHKNFAIEYYPTHMVDAIKDILEEDEIITAAEFNLAYQTALSYITRQSFMEATEPATDNDIREKLSGDQIEQLFERNSGIEGAFNDYKLQNNY